MFKLWYTLLVEKENEQFDIVIRIIANIEGGSPELDQVLAQCHDICDRIDNAEVDHAKKAGVTDSQELSKKRHGLHDSFASELQVAKFFVVASKLLTNEVVGCMAMDVKTSRDETYKLVRIVATVVDPSMHGRGISPEMFNYLEKHLKGVEYIESYIRNDNEKSLKSRENMGFVKGPVLGRSVLHRMIKEVDIEKAVTDWEDAHPALVTINPKKEKTPKDLELLVSV